MESLLYFLVVPISWFLYYIIQRGITIEQIVYILGIIAIADEITKYIIKGIEKWKL